MAYVPTPHWLASSFLVTFRHAASASPPVIADEPDEPLVILHSLPGYVCSAERYNGKPDWMVVYGVFCCLVCGCGGPEKMGVCLFELGCRI
ncbi:hypothetical protein K469DRAFT_712893 [Zopfia rhizophila CBS 207.26]|uniref:AB hydrolase-1 domain-containing protein n=1 Tax=Zopfia rhizophila CBS 207.26 TaxID=1314779 RepID=A0A6A6DVQ9_9PEZI|nr:hypothetical protein K469DRAFT_712893 [Zopfia rhizophila CBS 207.26]